MSYDHPQSASSLLKRGIDKLKVRDVDNARRDAEIMLAHVLEIEPSYIPLYRDDITSEKVSLFDAMVERRLTREPVAYITGQQSFWSLDLTVAKGVLIPRPDTETLVELGLNALQGVERPQILDIGTGTGCVLLSLLSELSTANGVGVDISNQAIDTATINAARAEVSDRTSFIQGDMFQPVLQHGWVPFDLIVSNPPYIPTHDIKGLMPDVRDHEPSLALDGGVDGLDFYRRLANDSAICMKEGATIAVEVGFDQAGAVVALFDDAGFKDILIKQDLNGIDRVVSAKK